MMISKRAMTFALPSLRLGGSADFGQLGRPEAAGFAEVLSSVVSGSCGLLHTLLLTKDGSVWSFGKAAGGRLGNGDDQTDCHEPHPSFKLSGRSLPKSISAGSMHSCLVTGEGQLFGWGYDSHGQVGYFGTPSSDETTRTMLRPKLITDKVTFSKVSCSGFHSAAITDDNRLFAWGRSDFGRCGVQNQTSWKGEADTIPVWTPQNVPGMTTYVSDVSTGGFFTVAKEKTSNQLLSFGGNGNGELGIGRKTKFEWQPQRVDLSALDPEETIETFTCGGFHTCLVTSKGRALAFGDNHSHQLGLSDPSGLPPTSVTKPQEMTALKEACQGEEIIDASCGPTYTVALTKSNRVFLIGSAPGARKPQLIYESDGKSVSLPDHQGAHHVLIMVDE